MYKLIRPILFSQDPEAAHVLAITLGKMLGHLPVQGFLRSLYVFDHAKLHTRVFGLNFENPVGLAAGFDKNAELVSILSSLGFGFVEVGTVTPEPQPGNPKPRLFRLKEDYALVNRLGFNGKGREFVAALLAGRKHKVVLGVNIGKNKTTSNEDAEVDYEKCFSTLSGLADYVVINVSSPNTQGLRDLQGREPLTRLLKKIQALNVRREIPVPLLLKIAPDLNEGQLDDVIHIVKMTKIAGIIATNTTIARDGLQTPAARVEEIGPGGLSGKPLRGLSTEVIRYLYRKSKGAIPVIGVGGIFSAEDAYEKIRAGASLVQVYTGLIYEGPGLVKKINEGLVRLLTRDGLRSIQEAVGAENI